MAHCGGIGKIVLQDSQLFEVCRLTNPTNWLPTLPRLIHETVQTAGGPDNILDPNGFNPMHIVITPVVMSILLAHGFSANVAALKTGDSPLHRVVSRPEYASYRPELMELLISHGANVNATNNLLWTPLHKAARDGRGDMVSALLPLGADLFLRTSDGSAPVDLAPNVETREILTRARQEHQKHSLAAAAAASSPPLVGHVSELPGATVATRSSSFSALPSASSTSLGHSVSSQWNSLSTPATPATEHLGTPGIGTKYEPWNIIKEQRTLSMPALFSNVSLAASAPPLSYSSLASSQSSLSTTSSSSSLSASTGSVPASPSPAGSSFMHYQPEAPVEVSAVTQWLIEQGLENWCDRFRQHHVTHLRHVVLLTEDHLKNELQVTALGDRLDLLVAIERLRAVTSSGATSSSSAPDARSRIDKEQEQAEWQFFFDNEPTALEFAPIFRAHNLKVRQLLSLSERELREELGIVGIGPRLDLVAAIERHRSRNLLRPAWPTVDGVDLTSMVLIGTGNWSQVYRASWPSGGRIVALKRLTQFDTRHFQQEASVLYELSRCQHKNIVRFFGSTTDGAGTHYLVLEYASEGQLGDYLRKHREAYVTYSPELMMTLIIELIIVICITQNHARDIVTNGTARCQRHALSIILTSADHSPVHESMIRISTYSS